MQFLALAPPLVLVLASNSTPQLDAAEMSRRAEYWLEKALRDAEANGELATQGQNGGRPQKTSAQCAEVNKKPSRSQFVANRREDDDLAKMGNATPDQFERANREARAENNPSNKPLPTLGLVTGDDIRQETAAYPRTKRDKTGIPRGRDGLGYMPGTQSAQGVRPHPPEVSRFVRGTFQNITHYFCYCPTGPQQKGRGEGPLGGVWLDGFALCDLPPCTGSVFGLVSVADVLTATFRAS